LGGVGAGELSAGLGALCEVPVVEAGAVVALCGGVGGFGGGLGAAAAGRGGAAGRGAGAGALTVGAGRGGVGVLGAAVVFFGAALRAVFLRAGFALRAAVFRFAFAAGRPRLAAPFLARLAVRAAALRRFAAFFAGRFAFLRPAPLDFAPVRAIEPPVCLIQHITAPCGNDALECKN
jgi:hypothetical protein